MAHVAEWKKEEVNELKDIVNSYDVIGVVDLLNIPAKQLQEMRKTLNGKAVIRMSKINLINLALEDCNADKTNIVDLSKKTAKPQLLLNQEPLLLMILLCLKGTPDLNQVHS